MTALRRRLAELIAAEQPVSLAIVVRGPAELLGQKLLVQLDAPSEGTLDAAVRTAIEPQARQLLQAAESRAVEVETTRGTLELFVESYPAPETLLIFGGVHVAAHLTRFAKLLGFRVKIVDARGLFATRERFPDADEIVVARAEDYLKSATLGPNTYVAVLTHDPKLDDPALLHFMRTPARYLGAVGSRKTNATRMERLLQKGATPEDLAKIHAPIGLDLGGRTPEEMALAIIAEIVAVRNGRSGGALRRQASQPGALAAAG
jgi:xanthine dehydrogenase accessory factor